MLQQRLAHLEQDGWQVDYADYVLVQQQWLPRRLTRHARRRCDCGSSSITGSCDR